MQIMFIHPQNLNTNKTNHPISSNSHPSATAKQAIFSLKIGGRGQNQQEHHTTLTKYEAVHEQKVTDDYSCNTVVFGNFSFLTEIFLLCFAHSFQKFRTFFVTCNTFHFIL